MKREKLTSDSAMQLRLPSLYRERAQAIAEKMERSESWLYRKFIAYGLAQLEAGNIDVLSDSHLNGDPPDIEQRMRPAIEGDGKRKKRSTES